MNVHCFLNTEHETSKEFISLYITELQEQIRSTE